MDTVDVKAEEKSGLLSAIQKEMKASKGYKVVKVIQVILLVLFWITLIATAAVSLLLNGAFELLTNLGQEIDAFSSILQIFSPLGSI